MIYKNTEVKILNQTKSLPKGSLKLFCLGVDGMVDLRSNDNLLNFWCSDTSQNFPSKENSKNNQGQLVVTAQPLKLCVEQKYFPWRLGLKLPKLMVGKRWWYFPTQPKLQGSERGKKICKNIMS